jgi:hypothetical protein
MAISDDLGGDGAVKAGSFVAGPETEPVAPAINPLQTNGGIAAAAPPVSIQVSNLTAGVVAAAPATAGGAQGPGTPSALANAVIDTDKISGPDGSTQASVSGTGPVTTSDLAGGAGGTSLDLSSTTLDSVTSVVAASDMFTAGGIIPGSGEFGF